MTEDIKFSLIVPVYNVAQYLRRCLDSIAAQDYHNYEVICVNDGSTDNSPAILAEYGTDNRFTIIHQENKGLGGARTLLRPLCVVHRQRRLDSVRFAIAHPCRHQESREDRRGDGRHD